jgi:hypothetical protein
VPGRPGRKPVHTDVATVLDSIHQLLGAYKQVFPLLELLPPEDIMDAELVAQLTLVYDSHRKLWWIHHQLRESYLQTPRKAPRSP